ncbi:Hypothetical protein CINCED_3A004038 [Cinara cedri]|uniref:Lon protease homolog n=1 Tax=Cinara cedri TaxID=506608 RepID=A0A5E4N571_9HEMI|nr:Hypothetical protein CINCED_3A004038 [Cinara cedri]
MIIPNSLPIIYTAPILIPGFMLKIKLLVEENTNLLEYLLKDNLNSKSKHMIGIIPKADLEKADNVIGTAGLIQSLIKIDSVPEEVFILVQGLCRFKLKETITEYPFKINSIEAINNFKELEGEDNEKAKLKAEFEKVFIDLMTYSEKITLQPFTFSNPKIILKNYALLDCVDMCLKNIVALTPAIAYEVLRATNLNQLLNIIIDLLKQETIKVNKHSKFLKTGLFPIPSTIYLNSTGNRGNIQKKSLSTELKEVEKAIQNAKLSKPINDLIMKEFNRLKEMNSYHPDYSVFLNYINYVINLPWNKITKESLDLKKAKNVLELNHYGMEKVKNRILQFIAVRILNPKLRGPILCFIGPPGVGKTTIAKTIADSLNRSFKRISLGGINHFSDIKGHRKTYVGSMPGCIIQAINEVQTKNPLILLDEIDKMYKGSGGDPAAALLEVLDPEQNRSFVDSYINLPFDLSQVMFITTANNVAYIPQTLRDRMEIIYLEGYTLEEKIQIADNYLIPKIFKRHRMNEIQITVTKTAIKDIIQNYTYEAGVRDLQRKLQTIYYYIAKDVVENIEKETKTYVITPESLLNIFGEDTVNGGKNNLVEQSCNRIGVAIGLSWTPVGGKVQMIETSKSYSRTDNQLILTGLAGQTLRESVEIALNWIQTFAKDNELDKNHFCVHVHLPEGGHRKDGPSAGITIVCALVSLFWNIPLKSMIAMTGEITLQGYVLPVCNTFNLPLFFFLFFIDLCFSKFNLFIFRWVA